MSCAAGLTKMKISLITHSYALAAGYIGMCLGRPLMTEWKDVYGVDGSLCQVRRMTKADVKPSIIHLETYLNDMAKRKDLPPHAQNYIKTAEAVVKVLRRDGVPVNSCGEVPACNANGIILTYYCHMVYFNDIEDLNREVKERRGW